VVAAPSTGQGKTTVATGLMAALRERGHVVSGHKVGPDYIDPGYHALATGRLGRNLDPHLVGEEQVVPLLLHGARGADLAVIEGVMGLHDGRLGTDGFASTAHVATLTRSPVVLVLDIGRMSRTAAAVAAGVAAFDPDVHVAGVVLNRAGSPRNTDEIRRALERAGLPVLGVLPRDERLAAPSRHLGLVPVAEREASARTVRDLGEQVARHLDLDALHRVADGACDLDDTPWVPTTTPPSGDRPVVAVAGGRAFTFRYPETEELLAAAGCRLASFDPLTDPTLPASTQGIYLGGGFPEVYAAELAANTSLLRDLRTAVGAGIPTVAECAGLLYLAASLDGTPMAGVVPTSAAMSGRLTLRYPVAQAASDSLLTRAGEQVTGHEFHRTRTSPAAGPRPAWLVDGEHTGFTSATLHASYLHVHWAGHPQLPQRFAEAVHAAHPHVPALPAPTTVAVPRQRVADPLRHHGDVEATPGLLDLAVNVVDGPRPEWLDRALHDAVDAARGYPDAGPAAVAISAHHGRELEEVLPTAGAAEAFSLLAQLQGWRRPVVVHPQFTEPHAALERAGHHVTSVITSADTGFALDPDVVLADADLVVVGNPTNPTGVLHPASTVRRLCRPGRVVLVDEAFMDTVPGESESLVGQRIPGLVVVRSLTKHWSIPGIRAGYVVGDHDVVRRMAELQTPWSVSGPAVAATLACLTDEAAVEAGARAATIAAWRADLQQALEIRGIEHVPSSTSFVLARPGEGVHAALRARGIAVRRADTFPGLDDTWIRIAVRGPATTARLLAALDAVRPLQPTA
jgi:cobyrinic acid a,c-diamide synthase